MKKRAEKRRSSECTSIAHILIPEHIKNPVNHVDFNRPYWCLPDLHKNNWTRITFRRQFHRKIKNNRRATLFFCFQTDNGVVIVSLIRENRVLLLSLQDFDV